MLYGVKKNKMLTYATAFKIPLTVLAGLFIYIFLVYLKLSTLSIILSLVLIILGSFLLFKETYEDIRNKQFGLDYIAILAVVVSIITQEYLVGIIIALMLATGRNLEDFGASQARKSLTALADRIPHDIVIEQNRSAVPKPVADVGIGEIMIVRKGEVVPLDGILLSQNGIFDESSLTGEAYPVEKFEGDNVRSGVVNNGTVARIKVIKAEKDSTYKKIVLLVERAQTEKAPIVRLADRYSIYFTVITFIISGFAYYLHHSLDSILAVLVVATPCPLILATPIALIGGMNAQAKKRIIIKKLASIESLSRVNTVVFDKTGTITLGKPKVVKFEILDERFRKENLLSISSAIERNSLHPLAKAIVEYAKDTPVIHAKNIKEIIGKGIEGYINNEKFILSKIQGENISGMKIGIYSKEKLLASFSFEDEIKNESKQTIRFLGALGLRLNIFTGDKLDEAKKTVDKLNIPIEIRAGLSPEDKQSGIEEFKKLGRTVAMVGDGINDAPALALADVGIVFANEEQTAASEAADIVLLNGNFSSVLDALLYSKKTISIAKQSILWGIGISIGCMVLAALGYIPPIAGSIIQEGIDVAVIINALRASRI